MSPRAQIRVLHSVGPGQMAGTQRALATYLEAADRDRFEHHVICCAQGGLVEYLRGIGVPVTVMPSRAPWQPAALARLAWRLRRGRFHIFHANPSRAEALIAHLLGLPVVCRRNVGFEACWRRQTGLSARLLNAPIDRFVVPARFLIAEYERRGVAAERIRLVHNGVSVSASRPAVVRARREMGNGAPLVVSAGRLVALKGHEFLLRAAALLAREGVTVRTAIIGEGETRPRLERLARELGIARRVLLAGWKDRVASHLAAADLYVQPSLSDVLPNAVLEAMALGRCVVASDVGGMRDAVEPGVTGELVRPGDAAALAAAVRELLARPQRRAQLGRAARAKIEREFSVAEMVRRTEAIYEELTGR